MQYLPKLASMVLSLLSALAVAEFLNKCSIGSDYWDTYGLALNIAARGPYRVAELATKVSQVLITPSTDIYDHFLYLQRVFGA